MREINGLSYREISGGDRRAHRNRDVGLARAARAARPKARNGGMTRTGFEDRSLLLHPRSTANSTPPA